MFMNIKQLKQRTITAKRITLKAQWQLLLIFLVFTMFLVLAGRVYYTTQMSLFKQQKQDELFSIVQMKCSEVQHWRKERLADAEIMHDNPVFADEVQQFFTQPVPELRAQITSWMKSLIVHYDYSQVVLYDTTGKTILSVPESTVPEEEHIQTDINMVLRTRQIHFTDLHLERQNGEIHIGLFIPVLLNVNSEAHVLGALFLKIDPRRVLFPLIQTWPNASKSSETMLVRREGEQVIYLNDFRYRKNTALTYTAPLNSSLLTAAMAARGQIGAVEGIDYRNVPVVAAIKPVPDTTWILISKADTEEVFATFYERFRLIIIILGIVILSAGIVLFLLVRQMDLAAVREKYAVELERRALQKHYEYMSRYANDIILLTEERGKIVEVNDSAASAYGYTREELLGMNVKDICAPETREPFAEDVQLIAEQNRRIYETEHRRKDGTEFPVEVSGRYIEIEGKKYYQGIIRDITERKRAEQALRESFERFQLANLATFNAIWDWDLQTNALWWNENFQKLFGYRAEEIDLGIESWTSRIHPEDLSRVETGIHAAIDSGEQYWSDQYRFRHKNGIYAEVEDRGYIARDASGKPVRMIGAMQDITERKRAEEALIIQKRIDDIFLSIPDDEMYNEILNVILEVMQSPYGVFGYIDEDGANVVPSMTRHIWDKCQVPDKTFTFTRDTWGDSSWPRAIKEKKTNYTNAVSTKTPAGHILVQRHISLPILFQGEVIGLLQVANKETDYTEEDVSTLEALSGHIAPILSARLKRERAEEALTHERRRFKQILDNFPYGIYIVDQNFRIEYLNQFLSQAFGDPGSRKCYEYFHDLPEPCSWCQNRKVFEGETVYWYWHSPKNDREYELVDIPLHNDDGTISKLETFHDITERKRAEDVLRISEERYRALFETMDEGFCVVEMLYDPDGKAVDYRFVEINPAFEKHTGLQQALGKTIRQMVPDHDAHWFEIYGKVARTGEAIRFENPANAMQRYYSVFAFRIGGDGNQRVGILFNDITEHKWAEAEQEKLRAQLFQSQKMETVGHLAGGIAHDFNNILAAIIGYANLLQVKMNNDDPLYSNVEHILSASERAATLVHSLLAFSRKQTLSVKQVRINDLITGVAKLLGRLLGEDITVKIVLSGSNPIVMADAGQIDQILFNLSTNARDAMPEGGHLTITTDITVIDDNYIKEHGYGLAGDYALITVSDTGAGMDKATQEKIFEPFFTTKEVGKGTGLGLSTAYGIVKQHNGFINCYSEMGKGTTFKIYLPLVKPDTKAEGEQAREATKLLPGGNETILVAEDDETVRELIKNILSQSGYTVYEAEDGAQAVQVFKEHSQEINLLLFDIIMPRKNGKEAYKEIQNIRPGVPVLFTSGYTADIIHKQGFLEEGFEIILKPVSMSALLQKVREVLDRGKRQE